jgi:5-formyltetrahydrofolate cyclo-ligase
VGLLYDGEIVDELPAEPHDQRVSAAVTPGEGFVPFPRGR